MNNTIKIKFEKDLEDIDLESGLISQISWSKMLDFLNEAFFIRKDEKIVGAIVSEQGIKVKIEHKK